ncbi:shikimate kinase [Aminipila luticellarii]|uniref:Shikimate kinase n=1 Tax=Aminipila luticellarii TaxID=2507160 RepID=A0A410PSE9_9FIRM|nr:shikimate kinase [Aminipila luticellarii]QAT41788.1 shikimate kinase [Aminipila luticellarii]
MKNFNRDIFLIGFMGTGKSAISSQLGEMMALEVLDTDALIVNSTGMSIPEIFERKGQDYFRTQETEILQKISKTKRHVISCGGGVVLKAENIEIMKKAGKIILLTASAETIYQRVKNDEQRPLLKGNLNAEYINELMGKRQAAYHEAADIIIETDHKNMAEICSEIITKLEILEGTE